MLEPKEIDNYFRLSKPKPPSPQKISGHTRWVTLAKLALPGLAAVLAVTLLVFPSLKNDAREFSLDFAIGKGAAGSQLFNLIKPEAILPMAGKEWLSIQAPKGLYDQKAALLHLQNHVEGFYSRGMSVQTEEAFFDLKKSFGYGHKPVTGDGFMGKISAEGFEFSGGDNILTFSGKTRMIINEETLQKE